MPIPFQESDIRTLETPTALGQRQLQALQHETNNNIPDHLAQYNSIIILNQSQAEKIRDQQEEIRRLKEQIETWETMHRIQASTLTALDKKNQDHEDHIRELSSNVMRCQDAYEKVEYKYRNMKRLRDMAIHASEWAIDQRDEAWDERDEARLLRDQAWVMRDKAWRDLEEFKKNATSGNGEGGKMESQKKEIGNL